MSDATSAARGETSADDTPAVSLMRAIELGDVDQVRRAVQEGVNLQVRNNKGITPLHWACKHSEVIAGLLLDAGASAEPKSAAGYDAADYARMSGFDALAERLSNSCSSRSYCPHCALPIKPVQKLRAVRTSVETGTDSNPLLAQFFELQASIVLEEPRFHALNQQVSGMRKEITESMAMWERLLPVLSAGQAMHVIDLCSGRSWTTALIALSFPHVISGSGPSRCANYGCRYM